MSVGPVYVLSTGRSGSTLLARLLSASEGHEPMAHQIPGSRAANVAGNLLATGHLSPRTIARLGRHLRAFHTGTSTADPLRAMLTASRLEEGQVPAGARIVHVVRDPRDFVTSFMRWKRASFRRTVLHHLVPAWQPNPWLAGEADIATWIRMGKFEHFCWVWSWKNRRFAGLQGRVPYRRFRLEDLTSPICGAAVRAELARFIGVPVPEPGTPAAPPRLNASRGAFPRWQEWAPRHASLVERHCGALMVEYGYGTEVEWRRLVAAGAPRRGPAAEPG